MINVELAQTDWGIGLLECGCSVGIREKVWRSSAVRCEKHSKDRLHLIPVVSFASTKSLTPQRDWRTT